MCELRQDVGVEKTDKGSEPVPKTLRWVNPFKCQMWSMHDRLGDEIDLKTCRSLLKSMQQHGQKQPVLGRLAPEGAEYEVELIYGARRLFSARHLGIDLMVEIRDMDNRTALIEMDIENRVRSDISPYERGMSYRRWLRAGFFSNQSEIAKCVGVSEAQVSRLLRYSELPTAIIAAFPSPREIREEWAVALAKRSRDEHFRAGMIRRARTCRAQTEPLSAQRVYDIIARDRATKVVEQKSRDEIVKDSNGRPLLRIAFHAKTVHLVVSREKVSKETLQKLKQVLSETLQEDLRVVPPMAASGAEARFYAPRQHRKNHDEESAEASV